MPLGTDHTSPEDDAADTAALGDVDIVVLLAQLPDDVLLYDRRGRLVYSTLDGDDGRDADDPGPTELHGPVWSAIKEGCSTSTLVPTSGPDGAEVVRFATISALPSRDGSIGGAVVVLRNEPPLDQRLDAERSREFDDLAASLPDVILRFDANGRLRYENGRLGEQVALGERQLLGGRPCEFVGSDVDGVVEFDAALQRVLRTGEPDDARVAVAAPDGTRRVHAVRFRPERSLDGTIVGAFAIGREITDLEHMRVEIERRESELRSLADGIPDVVLHYDLEGRVTFANRHWIESLGRDPEFFLGKRPTESAQPGTVGVDEYESLLMRVIETGEPAGTTIRLEGPDGDLRTHSVYFRAHRSRGGAIVGVIAIGRDITDLVRAEQRALDREREFRTLAENLPDVVNRLDRDGRVRYANRPLSDVIPGASDDLGFRPSDKELPGIVNVDDYERVLAHVLSTGEDGVTEIDQIMPSGERRTHQILLCAERDADGDIIGAISIARDVTGLVEAQQQVAERERDFRSLAENNTDLIARYDPNGVRIYVNPALAELFGMSPDELIGQPVSAVIDDASDVVKAVLEVIEDHRARSVQTRAGGSSSGQLLVHDVRVVPEFDAAGEFVSVLAIGRDVTDLVRAQQRVAEREREFRTLAENNTDYVSRFDRDGVRTYVNRALARLYRKSPEELVGQRVSADAPGDEVTAAVLDVIGDREPRQLQWRWTNPRTGEQVVHQVQLIPEFDTDGEFVSVLSIGHDITALIQAQQLVADREREFRSLAENNTDFISRYDPNGICTYANPSAAGMLGLEPHDLVGMPIESIVPESGAAIIEAVHEVIGERVARSVHAGGVDPMSGRQIVHDVRLVPEFDASGAFVGVLVIGRDVSDLFIAQQQVVDREREFRTLAENNTDFIARWDTDGVRTYVNPALAALHARPAEELIGRHAAALGGRSDSVGPAVVDVIGDGRPRSVQQRFTDPITGDVTMHDVRLIPEFDHDGTLVSVLGIGRDVTDALRHQDELAQAASTDVLTGVASRGVLYECLPDVIEARRADGNGGALILLDLDGFKAINDHFGHQFGDRVLQEVARRLRQCIGPDDLLVRLGGDEFVVILSLIDCPGDASFVAHQARTQLTSLTQIDGVRVPPVDVCMGIAFLPSDGAAVDELLAHADLALYEAKRRGRGHVEYFRRDLRAAMERRTTLEHALRACDPDTEMSVYLQPIYRLGNASTVWGAEALLRWDHPELGSVGPDEFVPIAEQTGDIIALGRWVLRQVGELAVEINAGRATPLQFAVNVSSRQFTLGDIEDAVRETVVATGVDPRWLTIELTESMLLDDIPQVNRSLKTLSELGVSLAIDDFGTGYSALQYLKRLDIDFLKIDKSFVHGSEVDVQQREIVRAIIALATALNVGIVAEGIETSAQAAFLLQLGCNLGQGYLLARPMPSVDFERWLADNDTPAMITR